MSDSKDKELFLHVGKVEDFKKGTLKQVEIEGTKVLIARTEDGQVHATSWKCTHYGAPLAQGVLHGNHVKCPWHGACFDLKTGDIEEMPAIDCLPVYSTTIDKDQVVVRVHKPEETNRFPALCKPSAEEKRVFVIVGGGAAGYAAIQTLRENSFKGKIILISADDKLPYDRPKLSKATDTSLTPEKILLRPEDFYSTYGVEVHLNTSVTAIDTASKTLTLSSEKKVEYEEVLVATGGSPRKLDVPGADAPNVFLLRSMSDASKIAKPVKNGEAKNVVIIGSSFIGLEIATWLKNQKEVTGTISVVGMEKVPLERVMGSEIGKFVQKMHEAKGVKFYLSSTTKQIEVEDKKATHVVLASGEKIPADVIIVGVGVTLNTNFLKSDGKITLSKEGAVVVDKYLKSPSGIYAAGDIAEYPYFLTGEKARIEHWDVALNQGRIAAQNMAGKATVFDCVPYFWTAMHGNIRYAGYVRDPDEILLDGKISEEKFVAYFIKGDEVRAVASFARDPAVSAAAVLFHSRRMPTVASIKRAFPDLPRLVAELQLDPA